MRIKIGSYSLADNLALLTAYREGPIRSQRGKVTRYRRFFQVQGIILGADQPDITTKIAAATAAFLNPDGDVGLYHDDGTTPSAHVLPMAGSENGIRLVGDIDWQNASGVEYATQRTFSVAYEATYPGPANENILRQSSRYRIVGTGGSDFVHTELISGLAVKEQVHTHTVCRAVQSGERWGRSSFPLADAPIATGERGRDRTLEQVDPTEDEFGNLTNYGITWQYTFERNVPFAFV